MKNKIYIKIFISLLVIISSILIILSGCGKSHEVKLISYSSISGINNLDPQTATSPEETTIINNTFEGLYKKDANGNYIPGMAQKIEKDKENKRYIFTLKDNIYWRPPSTYKTSKNNIIKVTANDFVFAFKRLMDPNTNSQAASNYFFIKNAKKIKQGLLPLDELGVKAKNEKKLIIELEYYSPIFEKLLALTPASPCNEAFFKHTNGRYGTSRETLMTNGPFFLSLWEPAKYRIRISDKYYNSNNVKIIGVNFSVRPKEEIIDLLKKENITTAILNSQEFSNLDKKKFKDKKIQNTVTGIVFNNNSQIFENDKIKLAVASSIDKEKISDVLTKHQQLANSLIPNSVNISAKESYNEKKPKEECSPPFNPTLAKKLFFEGMNEIKLRNKSINLTSCSILIDKSIYFVINKILQKWQKNLGMFLKINCKDQQNYEQSLKAKKFDIAVITVSSDFDSPSSILNKFLPNSPFNNMNYDIKELQKIIDDASIQEDIDSMTKKYFEAEKLIASKGYFIPLYFQTEYFVFNNKVKNILFDSANRQFYYAYSEIN